MKKGFSMHDRMTAGQIVAVSFMLFAMFFGAGNMIFPPMLGAQAGEHMVPAMLGFIAGDAGIAVLAIAAVALTGNRLTDLGNLVGKRFSAFMAITIYLLIGPLFALPRTGSVSFELAVVPFLNGGSIFLPSILFTAVFFGVTYYLSSNPSRIVDIVGKVLTPCLLVAIGIIFISALLHPYGVLEEANGAYVSAPFFQGFMEGYNALDGPAGLAFAVLVIAAVRSYGVRNPAQIAKYTVLSGIGASILLSVVYFTLAYLGGCSGSLGTFDNGGKMLTAIAGTTVGQFGVVLLGFTVLLACLTTSIGLVTSFSEYFSTQYPTRTYKKIAAVVCVFSFCIANVGLTTLIQFSLPVLIIIYPVTIVLILQSFFKNWIGTHRAAYWTGLTLAFLVSVIQSFDSMNIALGILTEIASMLPFYDLGVGWLIPALGGTLLGYLISVLSDRFQMDTRK